MEMPYTDDTAADAGAGAESAAAEIGAAAREQRLPEVRYRCASSPCHPVRIDDRSRKILRRFLRQIMPDAAHARPMLVTPFELGAIILRLRVRCTIIVAFKRDGRNCNRWKSR